MTESQARSGGEERMSRADRAFNFAACLVDAVGWPLGMAFFSLQTILPLYLRHLDAPNVAIGLLTAILYLLMFLPGLLVVRTVSRLRRARGYLLTVALIERAALLPLVPLTLLWGRTHPDRLLWATFACVTAHGIALGLNQPAYWAVVGKCIPAHWRGRLYGYAGGIAGVLGIGAEWLLRKVVLAGPDGGFPEGFSRGFLIGFVILTVTVLPLGFVREPETAPAHPEEIPSFRDSRRVWRADARFRGFLIAQVVFMLVGMAAPFFVLHAREEVGAGAAAIAGYTATLIFASAFGSLGWGALADRLGNRLVLVAASAFALLSVALALFAPSPLVYYGVFVAAALSSAGMGLAGNNIVMEYAGEARTIPLYTALYNGVTALPRAGAPLLGGLLADLLGYRPLFVVTLALALAALVLMMQVREPREEQR